VSRRCKLAFKGVRQLRGTHVYNSRTIALCFLYYSLQNWEIAGEVTQFLWAGPSSFANQCMLFVGLLICYKKPHTDPKSLLATESLQNPHTRDRDALTRGCSFKHHLTSEILTSLMALTEWTLGSYFGIGRNLRLCYRQPIKKTRSEWELELAYMSSAKKIATTNPS